MSDEHNIPIDRPDKDSGSKPERKLTGEEKRAKMKEQFKRDLRERKEFLEATKRLRATKRLSEAVQNMQVEDDTDDWVAQLNQETALSEAKMEMALETANLAEQDRQQEAEFQLSEEEMQKLAAAELVRQMKAEMAGESDAVESSDSPVSLNKDEAINKVAPRSMLGNDESTAENEKPVDTDRPHRKMLDDIED